MLHLTSPWVTLSWYIMIYLDLFMNPAGVQKQCWPLTSTLGLSRWLRAARGCRVWRREAARGACAGCEGPRGFRMSTGWVHDGVANQTSIRISDFAFFRSVDLLWSCCKDSMIRPGEAAFGGGERCSDAFWIWAPWDGRERREPPCGCAFPDGSLSCAGNCCRRNAP